MTTTEEPRPARRWPAVLVLIGGAAGLAYILWQDAERRASEEFLVGAISGEAYCKVAKPWLALNPDALERCSDGVVAFRALFRPTSQR